MFVCGPGHGTNIEMTYIINNKLSQDHKKVEVLNDFISTLTISEIAKSFSKTEIHTLSNQVEFRSVSDVLLWWKNHISFVPEIYQSVKEEFERHFAKNEKFTITKNVLGVHFYV